MKEYVNLKELEDKTAWVVERATAKGASTAVAELHQKTNFEVEVRNG